MYRNIQILYISTFTVDKNEEMIAAKKEIPSDKAIVIKIMNIFFIFFIFNQD